MAKSKHAKPDEELLGELRSLRKLVKSLRQRIKQLEKKEHIFDDDQSTAGEVPDLPVGNQPKLFRCLSCGKGEMTEFEILGRVYLTCSICGDRRKIK